MTRNCDGDRACLVKGGTSVSQTGICERAEHGTGGSTCPVLPESAIQIISQIVYVMPFVISKLISHYTF
jgi:hypothetical protein